MSFIDEGGVPLAGESSGGGALHGAQQLTPTDQVSSTEDRKQRARAFLKLLDPTRELWEFRSFDDNKQLKRKGLSRKLRGTLDEVFSKLLSLNSKGAGVFVVINQTDGNGQKAKNVTAVRAVFADTDGADVEPLLALRPQVVVASSQGKFHCYWRVKACELCAFKDVQSAISRKFGTDPNVQDLPRVMRVPGFYHCKKTPTLVDFAYDFMKGDDPKRAPYTIQEVLDGLGLDLGLSKPEELTVSSPNKAKARCGLLPPPTAKVMASMLRHLAARGCFSHRNGVEKDAEGRIVGLGWTEVGMALKLAYGDNVGLQLWALTHEDDQARSDAREQWASYAAEAKPGQLTIGTIIKAARDAGLALACIDLSETDPGYVSLGPFTMDPESGLLKEARVGQGKNETTKQGWISAPFEVLGACRDPHGRAWGKQMRFRDADGRVHLRHVSDASLQADPAPLCAVLADEGLKINKSRQKDFAEYLNRVPVTARVTIVQHTGWHQVGGRDLFVLPTETIGEPNGESVVLDAAHGPYEALGSLEDWKRGVGALTAGHTLPVFAVSAALAGPLAHLLGAEGGGIHVFGRSSIGKSSMLQAAGSVWGRGGTPGFVRSWRATANGLEGAAASATDTCLVLDELGAGDAREVSTSVYALANGAGKARAARDGSLREPKSWRLALISSGEVPVEAKLEEDRFRKARAGQLVRLLDIAADRELGFGAFDHAGEDDDAGRLADAIKNSACAAYGTAGPEFVRRLIEVGIKNVHITGHKFVEEFVRRVTPKGASEQIIRAARKFGLIAFAGELATAFGIPAWQRGEARSAAIRIFERWVERRGGAGSHEERQAVEQVRLIIERHGDARFEAMDPTGNEVRDRLGWRKGEGAQREYLVPPEVWKTVFCDGLDPTFVGRTLARLGMLRRQDSRHLQCVVKIGDRPRRVYALKSSILDEGDCE